MRTDPQVTRDHYYEWSVDGSKRNLQPGVAAPTGYTSKGLR